MLARKRVEDLCLRENDKLEHFVIIASCVNEPVEVDSYSCPEFDVLSSDKKRIQEERYRQRAERDEKEQHVRQHINSRHRFMERLLSTGV